MKRRNTGPTAAVLAIVHSRSGELCELCGVRRAEHTHHRLPRRLGGTRRPEVNKPSNLVHLDASCHLWVESNRAAAQAMGLLLSDRADPRREPVQLRDGRTFLDDHGGFEPPDDEALEAS